MMEVLEVGVIISHTLARIVATWALHHLKQIYKLSIRHGDISIYPNFEVRIKCMILNTLLSTSGWIKFQASSLATKSFSHEGQCLPRKPLQNEMIWAKGTTPME